MARTLASLIGNSRVWSDSVCPAASSFAILAMNVIVCVLMHFGSIGCSRENPSSPYIDADARSNSVIIALPEIEATSSLFTARGSLSQSDTKVGSAIEVQIRFTSQEERDIPPVLVVYWYQVVDGAVRRPHLQAGSALVEREGTKGAARIAMTAPKVPGEYRIEVLCRINEKDRTIDFPITVSP